MEDEKNVQEEELETNDEDDESATDESESGEAPEVEDGTDLSDDDGEDADNDGDNETSEDRQARKDRAEAQINRLKEENRQLKTKLKESGEKGEIGANSDLVERTYLSANGYKDRAVQDEVMRLAKKFDMSVDEAMQDADIKERADKLVKAKEAERSISKGTGGSSVKTKGVSYYLAYFKQHGDFPANTSAEMISKVTDELAKT